MLENVLDKKDNESVFEHHKRLIYGKLKDKTLADYDYGEMSMYLYGKELAPDETRKRMYGSCQTLELLDESGINMITDSELLSELDSKKLELQKERQKFFDQRREFNKLANSEGRRDHLYDRLAEAAMALPNTIGKAFDDYSAPINDYSHNEAVIVLGDWHYGMVTNNIWNKFDTSICRIRVGKVLNDVIDRLHVHKCRCAHIVLLGDFIHGAIHISSRVSSEELVCDQLMEVSEILAQFIIEISKYVECVSVRSTFGNHARTVANKKDNIHMDNMERIIPWWLHQRIEAEGIQEKVTIVNDDKFEFLLFTAGGKNFCASHGDLDSVKASPRLLTSFFAKTYDFNLDYILLGDKHHEESFEELGVEALLNGSLCGTDEYANNKRLYSKPSQLMLIVNSENGVDARYKLQCDVC